MHELSIARSIVEICSERAGSARINRVTVEVGRLTCVTAQALRFCFEAGAQGTPLASSELCIIEVAGRARCRRCAAEIELDDLVTPCSCGSRDLQYTAGEELRITEMEVA